MSILNLPHPLERLEGVSMYPASKLATLRKSAELRTISSQLPWAPVFPVDIAIYHSTFVENSCHEEKSDGQEELLVSICWAFSKAGWL
jgi:hypothetical protein